MAEKSFGVKEINLIGASGTPTIESPNNLNLNAVNVAISTNATIGGNLTVTGNIGIAGTLTYEDVTNIDAIGIVTARTGLKVLAGGANVVGVVTASSIKATNASANAGNHLEIKTNADSSSDIIKAGAGALFIKGHNIYIGDDDSNKVYMGGEKDGKSFLKFNNSTKIETTNTGVVATGIMTATTLSAGGLRLTDDGADSPILSVMTDDGSPWAFVIGNDTYSNTLHQGLMGYQHNDGYFVLKFDPGSAYKDFYIQSNGPSGNRNMIVMGADGKVKLHYQGNQKLETTSTGISIAADRDIRFGVNNNTAYNFTEKMIMKTDGKFGIGTSDPTELLELGSGGKIKLTKK